MIGLDIHMGWESKYGGQSVIPSLLYEMGSLTSLKLNVCSIGIGWLDIKPQEFTFLSNWDYKCEPSCLTFLCGF